MQNDAGNPQKAQGQKKRTARVNYYRIQNLKLSREIKEYLNTEQNLTEPEIVHAIKFTNKAGKCSYHSLYRQFGGMQPDMVYITGLSCDHRLCLICNSARKNKLRQMFLGYFEAHPEYLTTHDFMHLTLTVPHTVEGWSGKKIYHQELLKAFNRMRKEEFWKNQVSGGFYTVEFTENENGLHIHLHALVLAPKQIQSRNRLYLRILTAWNEITFDENSNRLAFDATSREGIAKSLDFLNRPTPPWLGAPTMQQAFNRLTPRGSTLVGLNNLYKKNPDGTKKYGAQSMSDLLPMILETLKYHFDPVTLYKGHAADDNPNGYVFDVKKLVRMAPLLHSNRLYGTFGMFYKNPELRMKDALTLGEDGQLIDKALDYGEVLDPRTGQVADPFSFSYAVCDPSRVRVAKLDAVTYGRATLKGNPAYTFEGSLPRVMDQFGQIMKGEVLENSKTIRRELAQAKVAIPPETALLNKIKKQTQQVAAPIKGSKLFS